MSRGGLALFGLHRCPCGANRHATSRWCTPCNAKVTTTMAEQRRDGWSVEQIAAAHRLHPQVIRDRLARHAGTAKKPAPKPAAPSADAPSEPASIERPRFTLPGLSERTIPRPVLASPVGPGRVASCCWPLGEPGTSGFRFCGDPTVPAKPYCDEHAGLAYVKKVADAA